MLQEAKQDSISWAQEIQELRNIESKKRSPNYSRIFDKLQKLITQYPNEYIWQSELSQTYLFAANLKHITAEQKLHYCNKALEAGKLSSDLANNDSKAYTSLVNAYVKIADFYIHQESRKKAVINLKHAIETGNNALEKSGSYNSYSILHASMARSYRTLSKYVNTITKAKTHLKNSIDHAEKSVHFKESSLDANIQLSSAYLNYGHKLFNQAKSEPDSKIQHELYNTAIDNYKLAYKSVRDGLRNIKPEVNKSRLLSIASKTARILGENSNDPSTKAEYYQEAFSQAKQYSSSIKKQTQDSYLELALGYYNLGNYKKAQTILKDGPIKDGSTHLGINITYSNIYAELNQPYSAEEHLVKFSKKITNTKNLVSVAKALEKLKAYDEALIIIESLIENEPDNRRLLNFQITLLSSLGEHKKAINYGLDLIGKDKQNILHHIALATAYAKANDPDEALLYCGSGLRIDSQNHKLTSLVIKILDPDNINMSAQRQAAKAHNLLNQFYLERNDSENAKIHSGHAAEAQKITPYSGRS